MVGGRKQLSRLVGNGRRSYVGSNSQIVSRDAECNDVSQPQENESPATQHFPFDLERDTNDFQHDGVSNA